MTPEARRFLDKAQGLVERAQIMVDIGLNEDAGRNAYLAGFHASQAFIFDSIGKALKSHNGVQSEFLRLTKNDPRFGPTLRIFLSQSYNLKAVADYETGPGSEVSSERVLRAVEGAREFVAHIAGLLGSVTDGEGGGNNG